MFRWFSVKTDRVEKIDRLTSKYEVKRQPHLSGKARLHLPPCREEKLGHVGIPKVHIQIITWVLEYYFTVDLFYLSAGDDLAHRKRQFRFEKMSIGIIPEPLQSPPNIFLIRQNIQEFPAVIKVVEQASKTQGDKIILNKADLHTIENGDLSH